MSYLSSLPLPTQVPAKTMVTRLSQDVDRISFQDVDFFKLWIYGSNQMDLKNKIVSGNLNFTWAASMGS